MWEGDMKRGGGRGKGNKPGSRPGQTRTVLFSFGDKAMRPVGGC